MTVTRGKFDGVINVFRFNWPMYIIAVFVMLFSFGLAYILPLPHIMRALPLAVGIITAYFFVASLLVSHLVYDKSGLYSWNWLRQRVGNPATIINAHAGFDETSESLQAAFPEAKLDVIDFFQRTENSEASILRARDIGAPKYPATACGIENWHVQEQSIDLLVVPFAAHEIRRPADRDRLFNQLNRVLKPNGRIVVIEHTRDLANFIAFGPGFMHFLPLSAWHRSMGAAKLKVTEEMNITPYVRVFFLQKQTD